VQQLKEFDGKEIKSFTKEGFSPLDLFSVLRDIEEERQ
jgi:hypothetical protein